MRAWLLALALASGCAHGVTGAYQSLSNITNSADASLKGFEAFDHDYQLQIVATDKKSGKTTEQIEADLSAYHSKRVAVNKAFADIGAVFVVGRALLPLVESGLKKSTDLNAWLVQLFAAAQQVQAALAAVGVKAP